MVILIGHVVHILVFMFLEISNNLFAFTIYNKIVFRRFNLLVMISLIDIELGLHKAIYGMNDNKKS